MVCGVLATIGIAGVLAWGLGDSSTDPPGQAPVFHDVAMSDPFCVRVEQLVDGGATLIDAESQALQELVGDDAESCLGYTIEIMYCDSNGMVTRFRKTINAKCLDQLWLSGCIPLTCPPGHVEGEPCVLTPCPLGRRPMWDTEITPECFGLPATILCAWVYPVSTHSRWVPCNGILATCDCFPEFTPPCTSLTVECRNPASPALPGDSCPNCN